jgi:CheY-like chemotaxis protein
MATTKRLATGLLPPTAGDVLLVEDDPQLRECAIELLSLGGFLVAGVGNGAEALAFLEAESPTLILLDLRMPVLDGWEFLRRRAASPALARIPVLIWSGEPPDATLRGSVEGWIPKPFSDDQLVDGVTQTLRRIQARRDAETSRTPTARRSWR